MKKTPKQSESLLEHYLDDALESHEHEAFNRRIAADPAMRRQLDQQAMIDASIRRLYDPPAQVVPDLNNRTTAGHRAPCEHTPPKAGIRSTAPHRPRSGQWVRRVAVAAILLLGVFGAWNTWRYLTPLAPHRPQPVTVDVAALYASEFENGFEPEESMSRHDLEEFLLTHFNRRATVEELPEKTDLIGITQRSDISRSATIILLRVDSTPVILLMDFVHPGIKPTHSSDASVRAFRHTVGHLLLLEITPHKYSHFRDWIQIEIPTRACKTPDHRSSDGEGDPR